MDPRDRRGDGRRARAADVADRSSELLVRRVADRRRDAHGLLAHAHRGPAARGHAAALLRDGLDVDEARRLRRGRTPVAVGCRRCAHRARRGRLRRDPRRPPRRRDRRSPRGGPPAADLVFPGGSVIHAADAAVHVVVAVLPAGDARRPTGRPRAVGRGIGAGPRHPLLRALPRRTGDGVARRSQASRVASVGSSGRCRRGRPSAAAVGHLAPFERHGLDPRDRTGPAPAPDRRAIRRRLQQLDRRPRRRRRTPGAGDRRAAARGGTADAARGGDRVRHCGGRRGPPARARIVRPRLPHHAQRHLRARSAHRACGCRTGLAARALAGTGRHAGAGRAGHRCDHPSRLLPGVAAPRLAPRGPCAGAAAAQPRDPGRGLLPGATGEDVHVGYRLRQRCAVPGAGDRRHRNAFTPGGRLLVGGRMQPA